MRASPSSASPWASHSSCTSHPLVFLDEHAGFSDRAGPSISFGAPADNRMSIAASEGELGSGDDDLAALPPSGRGALPESNQELTAMLSQAAESVWTTLQQLHTSTTKVVYASVACRNSLAIASSEASEVASRCPCPRQVQLCSRRALMSARPSGRMATSPRDGPADLETLRGCSGRPVCLPRHVPLPVVLLLVRGDPRHRCTGTQLALGLTQICISPSEHSRTDTVQGEDEEQVLSVAPYWPNRDLVLLATATHWQV